MNIHPIFVHFPIALLTIYSLMELVRWRRVTNLSYWFYSKAMFLLVGGLGALASLFTGDMGKAAVRAGEFHVAISNFNQVVDVHENFADASVAIFGILAASYLILWLNRDWLAQKNIAIKFWSGLVKVAHFIVETRFVILLALIGLICITITGGLGGAMVYGPSADPYFDSVYKLLFPGT